MNEIVLDEKELQKGFTIKNDVYRIRIPEGTRVIFKLKFERDQVIPAISFKGFPIEIMKLTTCARYNWFAKVWDQLVVCCFRPNDPPFPISYFDDGSARTRKEKKIGRIRAYVDFVMEKKKVIYHVR